MGIIKKLSEAEAQKLAAGEIVERPANIVKELLENAIDAHATMIDLYLVNGGKDTIRVVDNGSGMDADDAKLCFTQYATSKITRCDDISSLSTFGFRGEALSSIIAVSRVVLITKTSSTLEGIKLVLDQQTIQKKMSVSCPTGTDITVTDLFYTIPVRLKFLKKNQTEIRRIVHLLHAFCLDYPSLHVTCTIDGKQVYNFPPVKTAIDRYPQLWDHTTAHHLIPINVKKNQHNLSITGFISNHHHFRYDRSSIFMFVNKRWVKNQRLSYALCKGYNNVIPEGRYPIASIFITIDPSQIDINIHPRKEEITFLHARIVEQFIQQTVRQALEHHLSQQINQHVTLQNNTSVNVPTITTFDRSAYLADMSNGNSSTLPFFHNRPFTPMYNTSHIVQKSGYTEQKKNTNIVNNVQKETDNQQTLDCNQYGLLGQYKKTYLLLEKKEELLFIDQHAAHERILYERLVYKVDTTAVKLVCPQIITVTKHELSLLTPHLSLLRSNNIEIEQFGTDQLIVYAAPVCLKKIAYTSLLQELLTLITSHQSLSKKECGRVITEKFHVQIACKAAVKAGDTLTIEHMKHLLSELQKTANKDSCPHGRPTGWTLSLYELEKKFKRRT